MPASETPIAEITEQEFSRFLEGMETVSPMEVEITLTSSPSPIQVQGRMLRLKDRALQLGLSAGEFEDLTLKSVQRFLAGKKKAEESLFCHFCPYVIGGSSAKNASLPPFPVDCLPLSLREYVKAAAETIQVPVDMTAAAALAAAALCVQGKFEVLVKPGWREPLNLYLVEAANPSERKSPVVKAMTQPIYQYTLDYNRREEEAVRAYQTRRSILQSAVSRLTEMAARGKADPEEAVEKERELMELEKHPVKPLRLLADDATPEALTSLLAENQGCMGIISAEGGLFDMAAGQYSDHVNIDVLLKAYSGDPMMVDRKGRPAEQIEHPCLTMLLTVQPSVLRTVMQNAVFRGRGFLARILYTLPPSLVGRRRFETQPVPSLAEKGYAMQLTSLLSIPRPDFPGEISLSREAYESAKAFSEALEAQLPRDLEELQDWAGKYHGQVIRIAGVLHCCRYDEDAARYPMDLKTMEAAEKIGAYFLAHAQAAFQIMGLLDSPAVKDAKYILRRLEEVEGLTLSKRELLRMCNSRFPSAARMEPALRELEERGYLAIEKQHSGGKGRASTLLHLNPAHFAGDTPHDRGTKMTK